MIALRRLGLAEMEAASRIHRAALDAALPWLDGLHTAAEDAWFYRERVFMAGPVWGAMRDGRLVGVMACRGEWIDQLYVLPSAQGLGAGSALVELAQMAAPALSLWTFQRNAVARRFYERRGFVVIRTTDGLGNEEREPDVLYGWTAAKLG